jgi:hypothetical protein
MLERDLAADVRLSWDALRGVQGVLGGPRDKQVSSSEGVVGQAVDPSEVIVGRVFAKSTLANERLMRKVSKAFASAVFAEFLAEVDASFW